MLIDTHCHLSSYQFGNDVKSDLVDRALSAGIRRMISLGSSGSDWSDTLDWMAEFPGIVHGCLGLHPNDVHEIPADWKQTLSEYARNYRLAAIGETGLDYYHSAPVGYEEDVFRRMQRESLEYQFELAASLNLNIVLHTRDRKGQASFDDAFAIAERYAGRVRPVFHCFIGDKVQAEQIFDRLDGLISITGIATFKQAGIVPDVVKWCPKDRFMLETDAPYLSPVPFRGSRNEPSYLLHTAVYIAEMRGEKMETLAELTSTTAERFFQL